MGNTTWIVLLSACVLLFFGFEKQLDRQLEIMVKLCRETSGLSAMKVVKQLPSEHVPHLQNLREFSRLRITKLQ